MGDPRPGWWNADTASLNLAGLRAVPVQVRLRAQYGKARLTWGNADQVALRATTVGARREHVALSRVDGGHGRGNARRRTFSAVGRGATAVPGAGVDGPGETGPAEEPAGVGSGGAVGEPGGPAGDRLTGACCARSRSAGKGGTPGLRNTLPTGRRSVSHRSSTMPGLSRFRSWSWSCSRCRPLSVSPTRRAPVRPAAPVCRYRPWEGAGRRAARRGRRSGPSYGRTPAARPPDGGRP